MALETLGGIGVAGLSVRPTPIEGGSGVGESARGAGGGFAAALESALNELAGAQRNANDQSVALLTGEDVAVHEVMATVTEAEIAAQLTTAVAAKAIQAYQEIWRMEI